MTQKDLFPTTISSHVDTHVSHSQLRALGKEKKMTATSGRTSLELLHTKDPLGSFAKTFMVTLPWVSTKCCLTWKAKATPQGRLLFQLVPKMRPIGETDSGSSARMWATPRVGGEESFESAKKRLGEQKAKKHNLFAQVQHEQLWATPNTMDHLPPRSEEATRKMQEGHRKGRSKPSNLREQVDEETMKLWPTPQATDGTRINQVRSRDQLSDKAKKGGCSNLREEVHNRESKLWPTPNAWDGNRGPRSKENLIEKNHQINLISAVKDAEDPEPVHMWPTPRARDYKDGTSIPPSVKEGRRSHNLGTKVQESTQTKASGSLNPTWVEWLMGYPKGWTDLKD